MLSAGPRTMITSGKCTNTYAYIFVLRYAGLYSIESWQLPVMKLGHWVCAVARWHFGARARIN